MAGDPHKIGFFAADALERSARKFPEKAALISREGELTFADLARKVTNLAGHLQAEGLKPGDRVGLLLANSLAFALSYYAAQKMGAVAVVLDARLKGRDLQGVLRDCDLKLLITHAALLPEVTDSLPGSTRPPLWVVGAAGREDFEKRLAPSPSPFPPVRRDPLDDAVILYTSGTTGEPKGVVLHHVNLAQFPLCMGKVYKTNSESIWGCILPMSHISGPIYLNEIADKGSSMVIFDQFSPAAWLEGIERHRINIFHGVPTVFQLLLGFSGKKGYDTSSVRIAGMMGTTVPVSLMRAFKEAHPHMTLIQGYGLTESSPLITLTEPELADAKMASVGKAVPGVEIKIVDREGKEVPEGEAGEIVTGGPHVMKGYFRKPEATAARTRGGWLFTGDIGRRDRDGYYYHLGRMDDMIITGGLNVYPAEVENMLCDHPGVMEAVVFPIPDSKRGNVIGAAVVLRPGAKAGEKDLLAFLRPNLANFKVPQRIVIRDSLPRTSVGKIVRDAAALLSDREGGR